MERASSGPMTSTRDMPCREDIAPKRGRPLVRALLLAAAGVVALPLCAASPRVVNDADTVAVSGNVSPRRHGRGLRERLAAALGGRRHRPDGRRSPGREDDPRAPATGRRLRPARKPPRRAARSLLVELPPLADTRGVRA